MKVIQSTCNYCSIACNMDFYIEDEKIKKIIPTEKYPVNKGFSCIKGLNLDKQQTIKKFPKYPLLKQEDGSRKQISWEEAYSIFSKKLKDIVDKHGKENVACISTGQLTLEDMSLAGHVFRNYIGGQLDGNTRLCMATSVVAHKQSFGFDSPPYTLNDLELSDVIIFIGANPIVAHPILWDRVKKNKDPNKKIITIDIRKSETVKNSDYFYEVKPKADLEFLYILAKYLIDKDWIDKNYIEKYTENFQEFSEHIKKYNYDSIEENTGISFLQLEELAKLIHEGKRVSFWWTMGVNQGYQAVRTAQAIINLAIMTGNIGKPGTGANSITGQCNAMGSRLFSNTTSLYGGGDYSDELKRKKVGEALGVNPDIFPKTPTLPYNVIIEKIVSGEIKALWILCTNPRHSWINNTQFQEAVKKLELFVVQDLYDDTDSSLLADLYLPVTSGLKKDGTIINTERRVSRIRPVLKKEEGEKTDFEVIYEVGKALGMGPLLEGWETPEKVFDKMMKATEDSPCDMTGIDYKILDEGYGVQWPFKKGQVLEENERRLFEDNEYYTPNKKVKFIFEDVMENPKPTNQEYPYILDTGRGTVGQWHTQTRTREINYVADVVSGLPYIYISKDLGNEKDIKTEDEVLVESINGRVSKFKVLLTEDLSKNVIFCPLHYVEANNLTLSIYDTYSKEPSYKYTPVKIIKA
ncbi:molybdopterin oxidoreductase family protein [Cetobacterium sp. 8H]|uniref:molybdopterin oxidoreductase family protein n=1 Tax=Cetobacterium sp. 8H TaxID=2759681 RepID=UPI00163BCAEC|nr:molybdopterin oxidoreductase family protein [Cetobacterium sp. 8H]MBC2850397.1 molybdopterin oxidoreductase family protein [Cetobacterium sp. 8H]